MNPDVWATIVADSLNWEQAHLNLDSALQGLPTAFRGKRAPGLDRSVWELVEHIRISQLDLLEFCRNANYRHDLEWPGDYWPAAAEPPDGNAWERSLEDIRSDREALGSFAKQNAARLPERIPHGTGQTYLRTVLVAMDHVAYHVAQIVAVRRLLGVWPAGSAA